LRLLVVFGIKGSEVMAEPHTEHDQSPLNLGFSPVLGIAIASNPSSGAGSEARPASSGGGGISSVITGTGSLEVL
jgi:hypothetical protein